MKFSPFCDEPFLLWPKDPLEFSQMLLSFSRLPWEVTAVMLADTIEGYRKQEEHLISELCRCYDVPITRSGLVHWVERRHPRK